jgi:hypothetical protein
LLNKPLLFERTRPASTGDYFTAPKLIVLALAPSDVWMASEGVYKVAYKAWVDNGEYIAWVGIEELNEVLEDGTYILRRSTWARLSGWVDKQLRYAFSLLPSFP